MRYGEVDLQRVVFNAHYLAYIDDAMDRWMRRLDAEFESLGWDFMVKRAELVWMGGAGLGDTIAIDSRGRRRGAAPRSSSTTRCRVGDRRCSAPTSTYVGVEAGTNRPIAASARGARPPGRADGPRVVDDPDTPA